MNLTKILFILSISHLRAEECPRFVYKNQQNGEIQFYQQHCGHPSKKCEELKDATDRANRIASISRTTWNGDENVEKFFLQNSPHFFEFLFRVRGHENYFQTKEASAVKIQGASSQLFPGSQLGEHVRSLVAYSLYGGVVSKSVMRALPISATNRHGVPALKAARFLLSEISALVALELFVSAGTHPETKCMNTFEANPHIIPYIKEGTPDMFKLCACSTQSFHQRISKNFLFLYEKKVKELIREMYIQEIQSYCEQKVSLCKDNGKKAPVICINEARADKWCSNKLKETWWHPKDQELPVIPY